MSKLFSPFPELAEKLYIPSSYDEMDNITRLNLLDKESKESAIIMCALWSYQLIQKHLLIYYTKLHYVDFYGPLMPSSHIDIW